MRTSVDHALHWIATVIEVAGRETTQIVVRHGITGLETGETTEIRLSAPAAVVDVGVPGELDTRGWP